MLVLPCDNRTHSTRENADVNSNVTWHSFGVGCIGLMHLVSNLAKAANLDFWI